MTVSSMQFSRAFLTSLLRLQFYHHCTGPMQKGNSSKDQKGGKAVSRKPPAAPPVDDTSSAGERSAGDRSASSKTDSEKSATVAVVAPTWGGGKTFADILKKKEAEKTSAQS
mmetsp:Transcript_20100/g.29503  ORF Transcript_20100/g.29503 Transcript_20100/m.29503 type:complete len:112 (-) Transcript_20100:804-1139(-)